MTSNIIKDIGVEINHKINITIHYCIRIAAIMYR